MLFALFHAQMRSGDKRLIIGFAASGCEYNAVCVTAQTRCNAAACVCESVCGGLTVFVQA